MGGAGAGFRIAAILILWQECEDASRWSRSARSCAADVTDATNAARSCAARRRVRSRERRVASLFCAARNCRRSVSDNSGLFRRRPRFGRPEIGVASRVVVVEVDVVGSGSVYGKYVMVYMRG